MWCEIKALRLQGHEFDRHLQTYEMSRSGRPDFGMHKSDEGGFETLEQHLDWMDIIGVADALPFMLVKSPRWKRSPPS